MQLHDKIKKLGSTHLMYLVVFSMIFGTSISAIGFAIYSIY